MRESLTGNEIATIDGLTQLPSKRALEAGLSRGAAEMPGQFALLMLDLDDLKGVNDEEGGHLEGDLYILNTAQIIPHLLRRDDVLALGKDTPLLSRSGGDEFGVILYGTTQQEQVDAVIARLAGELAEYGIPVSIGGRVHQPGETAKELLQAVDDLAEKAKRENSLRPLTPDQIAAHRQIGAIAATHGINPRKNHTILAALQDQGLE